MQKGDARLVQLPLGFPSVLNRLYGPRVSRMLCTWWGFGGWRRKCVCLFDCLFLVDLRMWQSYRKCLLLLGLVCQILHCNHIHPDHSAAAGVCLVYHENSSLCGWWCGWFPRSYPSGLKHVCVVISCFLVWVPTPLCWGSRVVVIDVLHVLEWLAWIVFASVLTKLEQSFLLHRLVHLFIQSFAHTLIHSWLSSTDIDFNELASEVSVFVLLDVRNRDEVERHGQIPGSNCLPCKCPAVYCCLKFWCMFAWKLWRKNSVIFYRTQSGHPSFCLSINVSFFSMQSPS